jgi:hypothetical protein
MGLLEVDGFSYLCPRLVAVWQELEDCAYEFVYDFSFFSHLVLFIALIFAFCLWASFLDIYIDLYCTRVLPSLWY